MPRSTDEQRLRMMALEAAERSVQMEGLPPRDRFAKSLDGAYFRGELTADQIAEKLTAQYKQKGR